MTQIYNLDFAMAASSQAHQFKQVEEPSRSPHVPRSRMKPLIVGLLTCLFLGSPFALSQSRATRTSVIELIASPEKFGKKFVEVTAFLRFENQPRHAVQATLWLHEEDAKNLLPNGIAVVPSDQMLRDEERLDRMYVVLQGTFYAVPTEGGGVILEITNVQNCALWSNPQRPIGLGQAKDK
jgi:hypothetical protein